MMGSTRSHAVCVPCPAQGHITPMLQLAKVLHLKKFHITFVNTEFNHNRLLRSRGPRSLDGLPDFCFEAIPDGLPPSDPDATQDIPSICDSTSKNCLVPFQELLAKLNSSSEAPPVTCIISNGGMSFTLDAAEQLEIPNVFFWTPSACGFLCYMHYRHLVERGLTPLKDETYLTNGYLETTIDWIPGMKNIRLRDFPSSVRTTDPNDVMTKVILRETERASRASAIVLNTFDSLERDVLDALSSMFCKVYTIGPLHLLLNGFPQLGLESIGSNLWKEDRGCLQWLDSKRPRSVVYINFGSITVMTPNQLLEFAWGLANSKQIFLWIIRPDLVRGESAILPPEFTKETKDRGYVGSWCPQEEVLSHPSIGGFLTHCGWNSTLESLCSGVPMVCWPFFAEQQTNCRYACTEWGIGMEMNNYVKRDEVERLVRDLIEGEKGKETREKVLGWKKKAEEACSPAGSSYANLAKLVKEVLQK